jgi:hypothetical protein
VTGPSDTVAPAGITWESAMARAGEILIALPEKSKFSVTPDVRSSRAALAQAWIAFARELTMHARAAQ